MCANSAYKNLSATVSHISQDYSQVFLDFIAEQKALYRKYSGYLLGYGIVNSTPYYDDEDNRWYADIDRLQKFEVPVYYDDFKSFISINKFGAVTVLKDEQWERLKWLINQSNPGFFPNVNLPDVKSLEQEFQEAVRKEEIKPLEQLKNEAEQRSSQPFSDTVSTKIYHRDPTIAAYVKKRADGHCQLCGQKAPFNDKNGEPYLESHHIDWLSKGGMDSVDNCVALCPNCHRKIHILNDSDDIKTLKSKISS
ncbi:MAG: HNH endonuclease [Clostridia bacterium]|nr:HNH endonuclease [Clostridia bacterium]